MSDVIQATTSGFKDMADSTLRISFDIDARYAQEAFALFGKRGSSVAIAALTLQASTDSAQQETIEADKPKGGILSQWLAIRCGEQNFREFIQQTFGDAFTPIETSEIADLWVKDILNIESKKQLDNDKAKGDEFKRRIMQPYSAWLAGG